MITKEDLDKVSTELKLSEDNLATAKSEGKVTTEKLAEMEKENKALKATLLGIDDNGNRKPVLDRCQGIKRFDLDEHLNTIRCDPLETNYRRIANRLQNTVVNHVLSFM